MQTCSAFLSTRSENAPSRVFQKMLLTFFTLAFLLLGKSVNAAVNPTPPFQGWFTAALVPGVYKTPELLGQYICGLNQQEFGRADMRGGSVAAKSGADLYCKFNTGAGTYAERYAGYFPYAYFCPDTKYTSYYSTVSVNCTPQFRKKPECAPCTEVGNPIDVATKAKIQREKDYIGPKELNFVRSYSSINYDQSNGSIPGWRHNFARSLRSALSPNYVTSDAVQVSLPDKWWPPAQPGLGEAFISFPDGSEL